MYLVTSLGGARNNPFFLNFWFEIFLTMAIFELKVFVKVQYLSDKWEQTRFEEKIAFLLPFFNYHQNFLPMCFWWSPTKPWNALALPKKHLLQITHFSERYPRSQKLFVPIEGGWQVKSSDPTKKVSCWYALAQPPHTRNKWKFVKKILNSTWRHVSSEK